MILTNARVDGRTTDVRIVDGVIAEVGADLGSGIDLGGRHLVPGLWDHHVHFTQWALTSQRVDLASATSARVAAGLIGDAIDRGVGRAGLVIGSGFRDAAWPDAPNLADLDRVSGGLPVVLVSGDLHCVWLNSAALAMYGHAGHPTGLLTEDDAFEVEVKLGAFPDDTIDAWGREAASAAARRGVVGIQDFEMAWNLESWRRRVAHGHDSLRVDFMIYTQHLDRAIAEGLRTGDRIDDLISVGLFKVLSDGSLNTRTAFMHEEYPGEPGNVGQLTVPLDELIALVKKAGEAGIRSTLHAIGDRANSIVLDAFEAAEVSGGRIEHAQLVAADDFARFGRLGIEASVQPEHSMDDRDVADRLWSGLTDRAYAFRALLDAGATLLFGSDAPVSPLDPWLGIAAAVSRSRGGADAWHPEQRVTVHEALAASTKSRIEVGAPGDLAVIDLDPATASADELREMPVAATVLGGRFTYDAL